MNTNSYTNSWVHIEQLVNSTFGLQEETEKKSLLTSLLFWCHWELDPLAVHMPTVLTVHHEHASSHIQCTWIIHSHIQCTWMFTHSHTVHMDAHPVIQCTWMFTYSHTVHMDVHSQSHSTPWICSSASSEIVFKLKQLMLRNAAVFKMALSTYNPNKQIKKHIT